MGGSPDAAQFLGYHLVVKSDRMARRFASELQQVGLRPHEFSVLAMLASRPSATAAELADAVLISAQSMGPLLDRLEALKAIARPSARGKGRSAPARLTKQGETLLSAAFARVAVIDDDYRDQLGDDYVTLGRILDRWEP